MSDNMTINRLRFGFHRSDNRFQNSVPVLALIYILFPNLRDRKILHKYSVPTEVSRCELGESKW